MFDGGLLTGPMLGAAAGGLLGAFGGSKKAGVTETGIPDWQKAFVMPGLQGAQQRLQAGSGTPLLDPAQQEMMKTMQGGYLSPGSNPFLDDTFNQASRAVTDAYKNTVQPRNDAMFFGPGSLAGNSAYQGQVARNQYGLGENLSNLATQIYGGNYQQERGRQFSATAGAPQFTSDYYGGAFSPYSEYMNVVGRPMGQQQPYFQNQAGGLLGGALAGSQLGGMMGGAPGGTVRQRMGL